MKRLMLSILFIGLLGFAAPVTAQSSDGHEALKKHINKIVVKVEKEESADQKRAILDESLEDMITALERVESKRSVTETDKKALADFKENLQDRKDELNGLNGYAIVPNNQLNNYANFIQQDIEQADRVVTLSLTTALLIIIILLLL